MVAQRAQYPSRAHPLLLPNLVVWVLRRIIMVVAVLSRVRHLVLQHLDEFVEPNREDATNARSNPIDPMLSIVEVRNNAGPKTTRGIQ